MDIESHDSDRVDDLAIRPSMCRRASNMRVPPVIGASACMLRGDERGVAAHRHYVWTTLHVPDHFNEPMQKFFRAPR